MRRSFHVGVDVGGTFTDLVCHDADGAVAATKVPNAGADPAADVITGLDELAGLLDVAREDFYPAIGVLVHGTTVATNAVLTGQGARAGLITTKGFRDALEMRRGLRERLYDNRHSPPPPLVPRELRLGVTERIDPHGAEEEPLDEEELTEAVAGLRSAGVESVAVCFMHAYRSGAHEARAGEVLAREWPEAHVSLSHEVLPERRFYERVSSTVINAVVGPILAGYLERLLAELAARDFGGALRVMKSNGGLMAPEVAGQREAAHTLLSGPAGAVAGAAALGGAEERPDLIVMDMGGTSCDISLVQDVAPLVTREGSVARYRLMLPMLDIHTVGAGGGSIAGVDEAGLLEVGPASAGARPGPACYGRGGEEPTVTDADVLLGYVDPARFLGGRMPLDAALAQRAVETKLAEPLGLSPAEAAAGVYRVINATICAAIREVSTQRGHDPRRFTLVVAGGAGAVHACAVARDLGIGRIVVPRDAGVFSASGMLTTDFRHDFVQTHEELVDGASASVIKAAFAEMSDEGKRLLASEGVESEDISHELRLDLRYSGQIHEVELAIDVADIDEPGLASVTENFHKRHAAIYSYATEGDPVEIVNLRLTSRGEASSLDRRPSTATGAVPSSAGGTATAVTARVAYFEDAGAIEVPVFDGASLGSGATISGPALVELPETTIVVDREFDLACDADGRFVISAAGVNSGAPRRAGELDAVSANVSAAAPHPPREGAQVREGPGIDIDPILVAVLGKQIESVTGEMTRVIERTARSPLLQIRDFAAAVLDADRRILAQNEGLPLMVYGFTGMLEHLVDRIDEPIRPGDLFIHNDTFAGNNQVQDTATLCPVFIDGVLRFWTATKGHLADLGGTQPGGYDPTASDVWQESLRIPPLKVVDQGELRRDVWDLVLANSRFPVLVGGDLKALMGACRTGERALVERCESHGTDGFLAHLDALLDSSERRARAEISRMSSGTYGAESEWILPPDVGPPRLTCRLEATVEDGAVVLDFSGSDPQVDRYYNGTYGASYAAAVATFLMLIDPHIPHNAGVERRLSVILPEGTFLNAAYPAPSVLGNFVMNDVIGEVVMCALAPAAPHRACAGWGRGLNVSLHGRDPDTGEEFLTVPLLSNKCGAGAVEGVDGRDCVGIITCGGGFAFDDYEVFECANPITLLSHEYWEDSAGAGRWRGGLGVRVAFRMRTDTEVTCFGDGNDEPYGLFGGEAGARNQVAIIDPSGNSRDVEPNSTTLAETGSILELYNSGGGGYGQPSQRSEELIEADTRRGLVSDTDSD